MKGIVSALATSPSSGDGGGEILAAGTFTRHISLYDTVAAGGSIATFSVANTAAESAIGGKGVTQVLWSRDGRYLYVIERMSRGVMVYDIRVAGKLVGWLGRREGATMQRLGMSLVRTEQGEELWGGGADGMVRIWRSPHLCGGEGGGEEKEGREAQWVWKAGTDPITSTLVHPTGRVIATCSGQRHDRQGGWDEGFSGEEEEMEPGKSADDHGRGELDNRLKIWAL
jgi:telomerase Cajal body protein 1